LRLSARPSGPLCIFLAPEPVAKWQKIVAKGQVTTVRFRRYIPVEAVIRSNIQREGKYVTADSPTTDSPTPTPRQYWGPPSPPAYYGPPVYYSPPQPPKKRHWFRNTLAVIGALFVGLIVIGVAVSANKASHHPVVSGVQTQSNNQAHPPQADVNPGWVQGPTDLGGGWDQITGSVTNHSSKTSSYTLHFDLVGANGVRVDDTTAWVNEVQPGQTANFQSGPVQETAGAHATLTTVDRMGF
jgi:hypothetical protein